MKTYKRTFLKVINPHGQYGMVTRSDTLEGLRDEIDRANARAVSRGYKAEQFLIVEEKVTTAYDDDGIFVKKTSTETAIEIYPQNI